MTSKISTNPEYDEYYPELTVYLPEKDDATVKRRNDIINNPSPSESIYTLNDLEATSDDPNDDDGEYVLSETKPIDSNVDENTQPSRKPGHQRAEAGVYDELNYNISSNMNSPIADPSTEIRNETKCRCSRPQKFLIVSITGLFIIGAIATGIVIVFQGNYHLFSS